MPISIGKMKLAVRDYTPSPLLTLKFLQKRVGLFSRGYGTSLMSGLLLLVCRLRYKIGVHVHVAFWLNIV